MEKFVGCWELLPDQTTGFDEFSEALGTPKDKREAFKKLVYVLNYSRDGDQWKAWAQIKGHGEPKEYAWTPGVEFEYEALDGSKLKSTINWTGTCSDEKHELQNGGKWTSSRQVDGDIMTLTSDCKGAKMVQKFARQS